MYYKLNVSILSCIIRKDSLWDYLVFGKIQKQLGGKVRIILTGSAPIEPKVMDFSRCAFGCLVSNTGFL